MGLPARAPSGMPETMSWHSTVHAIAFVVAFVAVIAACFVFATRTQRALRVYCVITGVVTPVLIGIGMSDSSRAGVLFFVAAIATFTWLATLAWLTNPEA